MISDPSETTQLPKTMFDSLRSPILQILHLLLLAVIPSLPAATSSKESDTATLIHWLLEDDRDLKGIPFRDVLAATTGKKIHPVNPAKDAAWLAQLGKVLDRAVSSLNDTAHPIHNAGRVNEASRFIEDAIMAECKKEPGWSCGIPPTAAGAEQRSGYPDLRLVLADGSVVYLDPKLYAKGSQTSTLRTFYYEPKSATGKVHDDARHLLIGIEHNGKDAQNLRLLRWELVDVSKLLVQLKAEFQASNKAMYQPDNIVLKGQAPE